jgi:predicted MFS family arabinose efflux permease
MTKSSDKAARTQERAQDHQGSEDVTGALANDCLNRVTARQAATKGIEFSQTQVVESHASPKASSTIGITRAALTMMAVACGVMVGNVYLSQPLLDAMAQDFGVKEQTAGLVAVAAQVGYAFGILLIVPLADMAEPRSLVRWLTAITTVALFAAALAPNIGTLAIASGAVAAMTVVPQILIPLAASMAPKDKRGRAIGVLQTGLILGILLSRTISGAVASGAGTWRASYIVAGVVTAAVFLVLPVFIPPHPYSRPRRSYGAMLLSLPGMLRHRELRISAGLGFCAFAAFSAFWATLAFHLAAAPFGYGTAAIGLFGFWGAAGAVLAPIGGRLADRLGSTVVNFGSLACVAIAFVLAGTLGSGSAIMLVVVVNLLDFGLQSGQVANQTRIFALGDGVRARLNSVYMVATFGGGAIGSFAGLQAWGRAGWIGVCVIGFLFVAAAALVLALSGRSTTREEMA